MNKKLQKLMIPFNITGLLMFTVTRLFRNSFSDFWLGFMEGFSIVWIVTGTVFILWSLSKKRGHSKCSHNAAG
jgi:hypothetical protein